MNWRTATESDIGKLARFFNDPGDDVSYAILIDIDGDCEWYWCETNCEDDDPIRFRSCEVQIDTHLAAAQQRIAELEHDNTTAAIMIQQRESTNARLRELLAQAFEFIPENGQEELNSAIRKELGQ